MPTRTQKRRQDPFTNLVENPRKRVREWSLLELPEEVLTHLFRFLIVPDEINLAEFNSSKSFFAHAKAFAFCNSRLLSVFRQLLLQHRGFPLRELREQTRCAECMERGAREPDVDDDDEQRLHRGTLLHLKMAPARIQHITICIEDEVCPHFTAQLLPYVPRQKRLRSVSLFDSAKLAPSLSAILPALPHLQRVCVNMPLVNTIESLTRVTHLRDVVLNPVPTTLRPMVTQFLAQNAKRLRFFEVIFDVDLFTDDKHFVRIGVFEGTGTGSTSSSANGQQYVFEKLGEQYVSMENAYRIVLNANVWSDPCRLCELLPYLWYDDMVDGADTHRLVLDIDLTVESTLAESVEQLRPRLKRGFRASWERREFRTKIFYGETQTDSEDVNDGNKGDDVANRSNHNNAEIAHARDEVKSVFVYDLLRPERGVLFRDDRRTRFAYDVCNVRSLDLSLPPVVVRDQSLDKLTERAELILRRSRDSVCFLTGSAKYFDGRIAEGFRRLWTTVVNGCPNIKVIDVSSTILQNLHAAGQLDGLFVKLFKLRLLHVTQTNHIDLVWVIPAVLKGIRLYCAQFRSLVLHLLDLPQPRSARRSPVESDDLSNLWQNIALTQYERPDIDIDTVLKAAVDLRHRVRPSSTKFELEYETIMDVDN